MSVNGLGVSTATTQSVATEQATVATPATAAAPQGATMQKPTMTPEDAERVRNMRAQYNSGKTAGALSNGVNVRSQSNTGTARMPGASEADSLLNKTKEIQAGFDALKAQIQDGVDYVADILPSDLAKEAGLQQAAQRKRDKELDAKAGWKGSALRGLRSISRAVGLDKTKPTESYDEVSGTKKIIEVGGLALNRLGVVIGAVKETRERVKAELNQLGADIIRQNQAFNDVGLTLLMIEDELNALQKALNAETVGSDAHAEIAEIMRQKAQESDEWQNISRIVGTKIGQINERMAIMEQFVPAMHNTEAELTELHAKIEGRIAGQASMASAAGVVRESQKIAVVVNGVSVAAQAATEALVTDTVNSAQKIRDLVGESDEFVGRSNGRILNALVTENNNRAEVKAESAREAMAKARAALSARPGVTRSPMQTFAANQRGDEV